MRATPWRTHYFICHIQVVSVKILPICSDFSLYSNAAAQGDFDVEVATITCHCQTESTCRCQGSIDVKRQSSPHMRPHIRSRTSTVTMLLPRTTCGP